MVTNILTITILAWHTLRVHSIGISGGQLPTGAQWNAFGQLMGHPPAAEKCRARKLGCVVGASDTIVSECVGFNVPLDT